jgi:hypothetical protein
MGLLAVTRNIKAYPDDTFWLIKPFDFSRDELGRSALERNAV